jgi:hypothetical protein
MNVPGTPEGNWTWRFQWEQVQPELPARLTRLVQALWAGAGRLSGGAVGPSTAAPECRKQRPPS